MSDELLAVDGTVGSWGPDRTPLSAVMTGDVFCVFEDLDVDQLITLFLERNIGGVPVLDGRGRPIGIVSRGDLFRRGYQMTGVTGADGSARVADVMTPVVLTLPECATLSQAAALMAFESIHRIPVLSDGGRVVGIVSSLDIARWLAQSDGYITIEQSNGES
jgi:CBS domain-containing protein